MTKKKKAGVTLVYASFVERRPLPDLPKHMPKRGKFVYVCPRCCGTGEWLLEAPGAGLTSERCKPCGATGRVTDKNWRKWCRVLGAPNLMEWEHWITWDDWIAEGRPRLTGREE
jgi:hypothetical protein